MNQDKSPDNLHTCEGVAECTLNDDDTLKNTKQRAKDLAKIDACKKIDDYIQLFFKNKSFNLPCDEISAISTEIANVIDVKYQMQSSDNENMIIRAAVTAQFDDNDIINHLDKFFREKSSLVEQNEALRQKLTELEKQQDKDSREISSLRTENEELKQKLAESESQRDKYRREVSSKLETQNEKLNRQLAELKSQHDRDSRKISSLESENEKLRKENEDFKRKIAEPKRQLTETEIKFKDELAWKLLSTNDFREAIKLYDELIQMNPNKAGYYFCRSLCYKGRGEHSKAQADRKKYDELRR